MSIQDFAVREVVPLNSDEEKWLWDTWQQSHREDNPVFGRLDAMVDFTSPIVNLFMIFTLPRTKVVTQRDTPSAIGREVRPIGGFYGSHRVPHLKIDGFRFTGTSRDALR